MKKHIIILFFVLASFLLKAQIPAGYYDSAYGLIGVELRIELHNIIKGHTKISYDQLYDAFKSTDKKSNGKVWDMYSDIPSGVPPYEYSFTSSDQCGNYNSEGDCFNREHSWPKSWWGGSTSAPMYSDLFHLYPTDGYVNNRRGNEPFGEVGNATWTSMNGSKLGTSNYPGWSGVTVFEPIDEYKGDFARTYFYMSTRYYTEDASWPSNFNSMVNKCEIKPKPMEMLLKWHHNDPVSQKEINRNNAIYAIQHNRNPFIDHPEFADAIWDPNYQHSTSYSLSSCYIFPNPCENTFQINFYSSLDFVSIEVIDFMGQIVYQNSEIVNNDSYAINCENWINGCYFIKIKTDKEIIVKKLVKY